MPRTAFSLSDSFRARLLGLWRKRYGDKGISRKLTEAAYLKKLTVTSH